jgi:hypothetical protein
MTVTTLSGIARQVKAGAATADTRSPASNPAATGIESTTARCRRIDDLDVLGRSDVGPLRIRAEGNVLTCSPTAMLATGAAAARVDDRDNVARRWQEEAAHELVGDIDFRTRRADCEAAGSTSSRLARVAGQRVGRRIENAEHVALSYRM